jgi:hypothetical protein
MRAVAAAAVSIAVRCPTAGMSSWLRPSKIPPGNTRITRSTAASARTSQPPQASATTTADTTT